MCLDDGGNDDFIYNVDEVELGAQQVIFGISCTLVIYCRHKLLPILTRCFTCQNNSLTGMTMRITCSMKMQRKKMAMEKLMGIVIRNLNCKILLRYYVCI